MNDQVQEVPGVDMEALQKAEVFGQSVDASAAIVEGGEAQAVPVVDPVQEWVGVANMVRFIFCTPLPELRDHWTDDKMGALGAALAGCAQHYGWSAGVMGHPLLALGMASFPLVVSAGAVLKARRAAAEAAKEPDGGANGGQIEAS